MSPGNRGYFQREHYIPQGKPDVVPDKILEKAEEKVKKLIEMGAKKEKDRTYLNYYLLSLYSRRELLNRSMKSFNKAEDALELEHDVALKFGFHNYELRALGKMAVKKIKENGSFNEEIKNVEIALGIRTKEGHNARNKG